MASILDRLRKPASPEILPEPDSSAAPPVEIDLPVSASKAPIFTAETEAQVDALGAALPIRRLAEMACHASVQTPLSIGVFGAAGTGKSFALTTLLNDILALAKSASDLQQSPFLRKIAAARVNATAGEPITAIANALHEAFHSSSSGPARFAGWAEAAALRSGDPQQAMREESDRMTDLRRRQDQEKQSLEEMQNRRARLTENVLYDSAGTRIDAYARSNRSSIESRLASFGFNNVDPVATYKDLLRDYA